jgi:hypothetical protein
MAAGSSRERLRHAARCSGPASRFAHAGSTVDIASDSGAIRSRIAVADRVVLPYLTVTHRSHVEELRHVSASSRHDLPELCQTAALEINGGRREGRVSADTHGPRAEKSTRQNHRSSPISGLPCAMVLTLIRDLPGDRLSCPRRPRARRSTGLASAPGGQDHTISRPHHAVRPHVTHMPRHDASTASPAQRS